MKTILLIRHSEPIKDRTLPTAGGHMMWTVSSKGSVVGSSCFTIQFQDAGVPHFYFLSTLAAMWCRALRRRPRPQFRCF